MATVNEGQNNVILQDVLITDTLPGSATTNSILNPLSGSNRQNIGVSLSIADSKNQLATETEKLSAAIAPTKSNDIISDSSSNKSDDSLIVPDTLNSGLSESIGRRSISSNSDAEAKDTLTGSSKDAALITTKNDITATDPLTNNKIATENLSAIALATLAEKEQKPATEAAKNNTITEPKATAIAVTTKSEELTAENAVTTADISKDSQKENSTASSGENDKKVVENIQSVASETQKELTPTAPKSQPVADNSFTSGKFVVDSTGQVGIDYLFDGGLYKGQLAIISLKGMEKFVPGSTEFIKEAAARALNNSVTGHIAIDDLSEGARFTGNLAEGNDNEGNYLGVKTFAMTPGEEFGIAIVPNGTFQEVLNNPAVGGDKRLLFSMTTANPAEGFHVGQIADVTGNGKTFTMEDMRIDFGSDRDYNDFVFQVRGATGQAVNLDSVIDADRDWRKTDMGQALIAYSKPYTEPKLEPVKEDTKPVANAESNSVLDVPIPDMPITATEEIEPVSNSAVTKDEVISETKAPPIEEEKEEPSAPISPATESVSQTEVATSETSVAPVVKIVEEQKAIVPISPAESVAKTEVATSETTVAPVVEIAEDQKEIVPISPAESVAQNEVKTSEETAVGKVEDKKDAISPVSPATASVTRTEVTNAEETVAPVVKKSEGEKESIAPVFTATESVSKTETTTSKEPTHEGPETGFFSTNTPSQQTDSIKNPVSLLEMRNNEEEKESIAPVSAKPEIDINKNATASDKLSNLTETQTQTNTNPPTAETDKIENPVILQNPENPRSRINIPANNTLNLAPGVWTVGETGQISFDFKVDGGLYEGEIALVNLSGMEQYPPHSDAFKQEAVKRALSNSELGYIAIRDRLEGARFSGEFGEPNFNSGIYQGIKTFAMPPGAKLAVMLVPNGTIQQISEYPALWPDKTPLFSIPAANPDGKGMLADFTGKGNTFGWEDMPGNQADRDFNDLIFAIEGATANVPEIAKNVNANTQWLESKAGKKILTKVQINDKPPAVKPIADIALTPAQPNRTIDLAQVFIDPEASTLKYEVVEGTSPSLAVSLQGNNLQLTGLQQSGVTDVVIRATDMAGNSVIQNFAVTTSNLPREFVADINNALTDFTEVINQNSQNFSEALSTDAAAESLEKLATLLEQYPDALSLFNKPDSLTKLGIDDSNLPTIRELLQSPEVAAEFGLSVSLGEALSQPDSADFDEFLLNADEAIFLLPSDARQPKVGFIDFNEGQHVQRVTSAFSSINSLAKYDTFTVDGGNWAEQLMRFVDGVKAKGENRAIANLSFDLSQLDDIGITTRYELTPEEQAAIQYARENNVLLVVSAGNTDGVMSALGAASKQFDNIITVGAIDRFESKTDYSAYGEGLDLMAPGGSWANDANAFVGTSRSASYVTAAASLVWATNPALSGTYPLRGSSDRR